MGVQKVNIDHSRYFGIKQRVFLINVSENRDTDTFESLSGYVVSCSGDSVRLSVPYPFEKVLAAAAEMKSTYKLTSEYLGCGLQVLADVVRVEPGNVVSLDLHGELELFQHRKAPRVDVTINLYNLRRDFSLAFYKKEWTRVMEHMKMNGIPANLILKSATVNLSISGIRLSTEEQTIVNPLSMFFLDLGDGLFPVCAIAEVVWDRKDDSELVCAHRFIQIQKADQQRLSRFVLDSQRQQGLQVQDIKVSAQLLDRMTLSPSKSKS